MKSSGSKILARIGEIRATVEFAPRLRAAGLCAVDQLADPELGPLVSRSRSSWVSRVSIDGIDCYVKTYDYPRLGDRLRGLGRNTALRPSRAAREASALAWLRGAGFGGPGALALAESRRLGLVRRAVLVTQAWPGLRLDQLLPRLGPRDRDDLLGALRSFVRRLHEAGFRDRNLDLRNLLARRRDDGWEVVKIDSPRFRLRPPGPPRDRLAHADLERLRRSLAAVL